MLMAGSTIYLYGASGPECGQAQVKLDDLLVADLNLTVRQGRYFVPRAITLTASLLGRRLEHSCTLQAGSMVFDHIAYLFRIPSLASI